MNVQETVAHGVELLDIHMPGWELKIDLNKLQMSDCQACMLGQLAGDYVLGLSNLGIYDEWIENGQQVSIALTHNPVPACTWFGFEADGDDEEYLHTQYDALDKEWARVIKERLDHGVDLRS